MSYDLTRERLLLLFPIAFVKTVALFFTVALTVGQSRPFVFSDRFVHFLLSDRSSVSAYEVLSSQGFLYYSKQFVA